MSLNIPQFDYNKVLFIGVGGGFDIFGSTPLADAMGGSHVFMSYGDKKDFIVREATSDDYPSNLLERKTYVLGRNGVQLVKKGIQQVLEENSDIDTIIGVDGGIDSLMHGDEKNPGTILEDFIVMAGIDETQIANKYLVCLGFGTEAEEGIDHNGVLGNIAALSDDLIGTCSLIKGSDEFVQYKKLCEKAWESGRVSHIQSQVISAIEGEFGFREIENIDSRLYGDSMGQISLSPLMGMYWFFKFDGVIQQNKVINHLSASSTFTDAMLLFRNIPRLKVPV